MQHPRRIILHLIIVAALATSFLAGTITTIHAEATEARISHGYGILYLLIMVIASEHLLEKQAKAAGLGDVKTSYCMFDDGDVINGAMLSGTLDIVPLGVPGFFALWDKMCGGAMEVRGLSSLSSPSVYLTTRSPNMKTLADFFNKGRIAVPGIKTLSPAVVLQITTVKTFSDKQFNRLDPITMPLPYPDAVAVMLAGGSQVNSHMASPPSSYTEVATPSLHHVFNTVDVFGDITLDMICINKKFYEVNPKLLTILVATLNEASTLIARDKTKAAQIHVVQSKAKNSLEEVKKILDDPDPCFMTTPVGAAHYVEFMQRVGTFKNKSASWEDLFFPTVQSRQGP